MQMFGVGIMELLVILGLAVIVIGPDRVPQFASDLARWIRQARAYANHLMKDFNEVVSELEKEAGATREDWREIASVVNRHTGDVVREVQRVATQIEASTNIDGAQNGAGANAVIPVAANGHQTSEPPPMQEAEESPATGEGEPQPDEEKPWYVPERNSRRRAPD